MLSLSVTSPTSALADLTFCHLSPLEEQSSSPSLEGNSGTVPMIYTSQAPVMGPPSSVVICLGPKHCGASKRPLSSSGNCGLAEDKSTATNSDTSTSEWGTSTKRRPLARPSSISVVPIVSENDQISPNFGSFSWLTATGSQRSASQIVPSFNVSKSNDNFASKCMDSAHSSKYFPELCFNIAKTQEGSILPDENSTNVVTNWGSNALETLEFCNKTSVTCPSIALDPSAKSRKQIRPDESMILPDTFVFSPFAQKHIEFLTYNFCAAVPNSNKVTCLENIESINMESLPEVLFITHPEHEMAPKLCDSPRIYDDLIPSFSNEDPLQSSTRLLPSAVCFESPTRQIFPSSVVILSGFDCCNVKCNALASTGVGIEPETSIAMNNSPPPSSSHNSSLTDCLELGIRVS